MKRWPYYSRPWPLKGELQMLGICIIAVAFVTIILLMLVGCKPPPPPGVGEVQLSCIDFSKHPREVPCPAGSPSGSVISHN
jgi:hypothetical protein